MTVPYARAFMPAISLWQPYASLVAILAKPWETRHWPAPPRLIGQRIAIHAAARKVTRDEFAQLDDLASDAFGFCHWHLRIPYGAVVCTAILAGCYRVTLRRPSGVVTLENVSNSLDLSCIQDDGFGDYSAGRYCWRLTDVEPLDPPVPAKGHQGWWSWEGPQS